MKKVLFIPGPSEVENDVLLELSKPVIPHYGSEWHAFFNRTCDTVRKIFRTKGYVTILPIPGTVSIEMSIFNVVENEGDNVINVSNGSFGELIGRMLDLHGAKVLNVKDKWGDSINMERLKATLDENPDSKAIYMVQNDTSTGVLNNVKEVGKIARKYDKLFVVDTVSSFGGVELDFDDWGIDYAIGYASKCLSSINGVCPIAVSDRFMEYVQKRKRPVRSYYFNLPVYMEVSNYFASVGQPHPTSVPTPVIRALYYSANRLLEEGLERRYRRHRRIARAYRKAIRAMGLDIVPKEEDASPTVTVFNVPKGSDKKIMATLLERYGFMIGGGLGELRGKTLRIGHMGSTAQSQYLMQLVSALEFTLKELDIVDKVGPGLQAAIKDLRKV